MICALLLGREGSHGFPGKNVYPVLGRPLVAYPLMVAEACPMVDRVYISTDSPRLIEIASAMDCCIINRPPELASKTALGEDAYLHGYRVIRDQLVSEGKSLELLVLLFANAPTLTPEIISEGISVLKENPEYDSAVTVSSYNMWSPLRARKINNQGLLDPFVPFETFGDPSKLNCDRDSQGDVWFADMGLSVVRPRCMDNLQTGLLPQKWMGQKIYPLKQWGGLDVDEPWQIPAIEAWLQAHEIDKLFSVHRTSWANLYDSERTILSTLDFNSNSRVLDIGNDPGGLGLALGERFGVRLYDAIQQNNKKREEALIINPAAHFLNSSLEEMANNYDFTSKYDAVISLNDSDQKEYFTTKLQCAYDLVCPGGVLIFSCRVTEGETVEDINISFIEERESADKRSRERYVVKNIHELFDIMTGLKPDSINGYGYSGTPSSSATTPFKIINFAVFSIKKPAGESRSKPDISIQLPEHLRRSIGEMPALNI